MSEQDNINAAQSFYEAWNSGDLSKADHYYDENVVVEGPGAAGPMNWAQNQQYNQNFFTAFPGSKFQVMTTITQGDYVVTNWKVSGKHTGPLGTPSGGSVPPTGKSVTMAGSTTVQIKNGKIVHSWNFFDMASMLGQLGLMPPM
jgi:steroid delta-isomerase-like uncharacterized protein